MNEVKKKNKSALMIKNNMDDIRNVKLIAEKETTKLRCKCQHMDDSGSMMLFRSDDKKSDYTGAPLFCCRLCGAYLDISELDEDRLDHSIDDVCRSIEIIKMRLRPEVSEDDKDLLKKLAQTEFLFKSGKYMKLFRSARRRNNKKRNNNNNTFFSGNPVSR